MADAWTEDAAFVVTDNTTKQTWTYATREEADSRAEDIRDGGFFGARTGDYQSIGKTYTSTMAGGMLERAVRPFQILQTKLPDPPKPQMPLPGQTLSEAFLAWGGASNFETPDDGPDPDVNADKFGTSDGSTATPGSKTKPKKEKKPQDKQSQIISLDEIDRSVETVTAYQPDNNQNWVNVQRVLSMRLRNRGTGAILKLNLKPPRAPERPADAA